MVTALHPCLAYAIAASYWFPDSWDSVFDVGLAGCFDLGSHSHVPGF